MAWGVRYNEAPPGNDYVAIAAGGDHSLALKSDGSIVGWDRWGDSQATPPGNDYVAIAAGWYYSLALKADGSIVGWGSDEYGQATPPAGNGYVAIAAGGHYSIALKADPLPLEVEIDVKPGSDRNPINPRSRGLISVAILSTDTFDATTLDPETIELSGAKVAIRRRGEFLVQEKDVDHDGDIDLLVKIDSQGLVIEPGATIVTLTGRTFDGIRIEGSDDIALVGDLDGDGVVGIIDLNIVLTQWGKTGRQITDLRADVDHSGDVGLEDLNAVLIDWGK